MIAFKIKIALAITLLIPITSHLCTGSAVEDISDSLIQSGCPDACTMEYAPVCATLRDGSKVEFSNKCMINKASCGRQLDIQDIDDGKCGYLQIM